MTEKSISISVFRKDVAERSKLMEREIETMTKPTSFWKLRPVNKWYLRRFKLDMKNLIISYEPSQKAFWNNSSTYVDLLDVKDVRSGWKTDTFKKTSRLKNSQNDLVENRCFSLIYGNDNRSWDLVAANEEIVQTWVDGLSFLINLIQSLRQEKAYEGWLSDLFHKADKDKSGSLTFNECLTLLQLLNIKLDNTYTKQLFEKANTNKTTVKGKQVLDCEEFLQFTKLLFNRPELDDIFKKFARSSISSLTADELCNFLRKQQCLTDVNISRAAQLIDIYEKSSYKERGLLTFNGFMALMTSSMFDILDDRFKTVYQDMDQPLTHYYIASSHNTYLTGNQLTSESSIEAYIRAIEQGCRCLEMDLWDGPNKEPIIRHGHTMTTSIFLTDVLTDAIKPHAFKYSSFPLILSLENNLKEQDDRLAYHLKNILGDMLYSIPVTEDMEQLPSPFQLKEKIILKLKVKSKERDFEDEKDLGDDEFDDDSMTDVVPPTETTMDSGSRVVPNLSGVPSRTELNSSTLDGKGINMVLSVSEGNESGKNTGSLALLEQNNNTERSTSQPVDSVSKQKHITDPTTIIENHVPQQQRNGSDKEEADQEKQTADDIKTDPDGCLLKSNKSSKSLKESSISLSSLANLCQAVKFRGFHHKIPDGRCYHMSSLSEKKAEKLMTDSPIDFINHTNKQLVRIYPVGTRMGSSNYDPIPFWNSGCQIVALNYQTSGMEMITYKGKFLQNGNCGYVLKPSYLNGDNTLPDPKKIRKRIRLQIISGQYLPKVPGKNDDIIDPYVAIKIQGHPDDQFIYETQHVKDNGFNPIWNETVNISLRMPELDMLYFIVKEKDKYTSSDFVGWYTIPVECIGQGYRHVPLLSFEGSSLSPATLFVHVSLEEVTE